MNKVSLWIALAWVLGSIPQAAWGQIAESPWPMFQHDMYHTGYSLFPGPINGAEVEFETQIGAGYSSPVIGFDGTIYVGSSDGCLYAVSPDGQDVDCLYETEGEVRSTPVLSRDGRIYVGSDDGYLYALSLGGRLEWKLRLGDRVRSAPAIGPGGNIYVGSLQSSDSGFLFRISPEGKILWQYPTGNISYSYPAVDSFGNVYIGSLDGNLYKLTDQGVGLWRYESGDAIASSPVISPDGSIYFCSPDELVALSSDGERQWSFTPIARLFGFEDASGLVAAPAVDPDGRVYLGGVLGDLHCLDDRGELQWSVMLKELTLTDPVPLSILSSPAVWGPLPEDGRMSGQYVSVNVMDGVYTLSAEDGSLRYSVRTGPSVLDNMTIMASPAFCASGMMVSANPDGSLYGIGPSGTLLISGAITGLPEGYPEDLRRRVLVNIQGETGEVRQVRVGPDGQFAAPVFSRGTFLLSPQGGGLTFDPPSREATVLFSSAEDMDFAAQATFPVILSASAVPTLASSDSATPVQLSADVFWPGSGNLNGSVDLSEIGGRANEPMAFTAADPGSPDLSGRFTLAAEVPAGLPIGPKFLPVRVRPPLMGDREARSMIALNVAGAYAGSGAATHEIVVDQPWPLLIITYSSTDWRYRIDVFAPGSPSPDYFAETTAEQREGAIEISDPGVGTWIVAITPLEAFEGISSAAGRASARGIASASSGQYRVSSAAAGTGVIFGSVSDLLTGELVINSSVQVRTASGAGSPTQEGFYVLLSPAGAFTVNALDLSGAYAPAVKSGSLMTGGAVEANLMMQTAGESSACALDFLFQSNPEPLGRLRAFRDRVLAQTKSGRSLTRLYYGCAAEVKEILRADPGLQQESVRTLAALLPVIEKALRGEKIELSPAQKRLVESCLKAVRAQASSGLAAQISRIVNRLESGALPGMLSR